MYNCTHTHTHTYTHCGWTHHNMQCEYYYSQRHIDIATFINQLSFVKLIINI